MNREVTILFICAVIQLSCITILVWDRRRIVRSAANVHATVERERVAIKAVDRKLEAAEMALRVAKNDVEYWEALARRFEEEVMKIAAGRS